jgi:hypothetical protein
MEDVGANPVARCSFCGATAADESALVQGGGDAKDLPVVQICAECVEVCAEALQLERRIGEARASQRPPASRRAGSKALGVIRDWSPFSMEGKEFEWRAERRLTTHKINQSLLKLRVAGQSAELIVELDDGVMPGVEHVKAATPWLADTESAEAKPRVLQDWTRLEHQGRAYEWRAERSCALTLKPKTVVSVRSPSSGESTAMEFDPRIEPSVDEAVMTASAGKIALEGDDDDLPDAVVT